MVRNLMVKIRFLLPLIPKKWRNEMCISYSGKLSFQSFQTLDKELPPAELLSAKRKGVRTKSASRGQHVTVFVMYTDALGKI